MMGSSSSEDDEFQKRLQEVVEGSELGFKSSKAATNVNTSAKPSLRYNADEDSDDGGDSVSTAGFKAHMSKKLSSFLDKAIVEVTVPPVVDTALSEDVQWSGLKLFSSSDGGRVKTSQEVARELDAQRQRKRRCPSVSSGSEDDAEEVKRLASAAVSGFDIMQKGDIKTSSSTAVSAVPLSEQTGDESRQLVASTRDGNDHCSGAIEEVPKKKKKKKKKSKQTDCIESIPSMTNTSNGNSKACEQSEVEAKKKKKKSDAEPNKELKEEEEPRKHKQKKKKHQVHELS